MRHWTIVLALFALVAFAAQPAFAGCSESHQSVAAPSSSTVADTTGTVKPDAKTGG